jgi:hypothetical protein
VGFEVVDYDLLGERLPCSISCRGTTKKTEASLAAKTARMGLELVDRYLLGEPVSKPDVVAALLAERSDDPAAAPFYRAFEAVGARAADEAFIALRLVLAGKPPEDDAVRRLRGLTAVARAGRAGDGAGLAAALKRDGKILSDLPPGPFEKPAERDRLVAAATAAYRAELT